VSAPERRGVEPTGHPASGWQTAASRIVLGLALVAVGVIFTLNNLDIVDALAYLHLWPLLLVGLGVAQLFTREIYGGLIVTALGSWLLAYNVGYLRHSPWELWPLLFVVIGGGLMLRALRPRAIAGDPSAVTHGFALLSAVTRKSTSQQFHGGSFTAVMGGCDLDLRGAKLAGGRAVVDTFAFWGGIGIQVPPTWRVTSQVWAFLGGFEDKSSPPAPEEADGELVVTGWAVMGGVEVKN
jgi:hypothetical protein